jgi:hypothetical protein
VGTHGYWLYEVVMTKSPSQKGLSYLG